MSKELPADMKALQAAIRANRRLLSLLDKDIAEASLVDPDLINLDPDQSQSFTLVTMDGTDGDPGININVVAELARAVTQGVSNPYYGIARTDGDAAFVCTGLSAYVRINDNFAAAGAIDCFYDAPTAIARFGLGVRILDDTSGRRLSMVYSPTGMPWQSAVVPLDALGQSSFANVGGIGNVADCTFPRNTTIRVEAFSTNINSAYAASAPTAMRVHVLFHGYKVFGG